MTWTLPYFRTTFGISAHFARFAGLGTSALMALLLVSSGAFAQQQPAPRDSKPGLDLKDGPGLFSRKGNGAGVLPREGANAQERDWIIVLAAFRGETHAQAAAEALPKLQKVEGLREAFVSPRGEATFIGLGRFAEPGDEKAQALIAKVRATEVERTRPFAQAFMAPPLMSDAGSRPEFDLANARKQFGKTARMTLQVGVYGRDDLPKISQKDLAEVRKTAEEAVLQLRREGQLAFYYHSPRRSMVTIGVFSEEDLKPAESPEINKLRKLFPNNLYNGQGIREKVAGVGDLGLQKSFLVQVPDR